MSKFKKGFSLVELLVVIAIIGILAAVGITAYSGYTANAKIKVVTAQHGQVVALINAEFAKCASGSGEFPWGGDCNADTDAAEIVVYFALDGTTPLPNAYNNDIAAVSEEISAEVNLSEDIEGVVVVSGQIAIACATSVSCQVSTDTGEGDNLVATIARY
jgi:type IV pilus assembly protein PilA